MSDVTLSRDDYEVLRQLALLQVAATSSRRAELRRLLSRVESANSIDRYSVWVRWVDAQNTGVFPKEDFPKQWPPQQEVEVTVEGRPVSRADILAAIRAQGGGSPAQILVSKDPNKLVGWGTLDVLYPE